jgi:hypothetical protein
VEDDVSNPTPEQVLAQALKDKQAIAERMNRIEGEHHGRIERLQQQLTAAGVIEDDPDVAQSTRLDVEERVRLMHGVLVAARAVAEAPTETRFHALRDALYRCDTAAYGKEVTGG